MFRIVVIEDNILMRKLLQKTLVCEGFECLLAASAMAGSQVCARERPDLVLLDVNLPDGDGIDLCREFKNDARLRHIPILLLTGEAFSVETRVEGLEAGAEDYVLKPFNSKELVSRIKGILRTSARPTLA